jgi:RNA polymerase-binding transcription factor DksA
MMTKDTALRARLETRLGTLLARVRKIEGDLRQSHDRDWQERATELENDDVLEGLDELGRAEVRELRAALHRMDAGKYGFCVACGEPIGAERLRAVPTAAKCRVCAE